MFFALAKCQDEFCFDLHKALVPESFAALDFQSARRMVLDAHTPHAGSHNPSKNSFSFAMANSNSSMLVA